MAAANVNVPDILDEAIEAMEEAEVEEEDEDVEEEDEDVEDVEDEAKEDRDLLMYSFAVFGYNASCRLEHSPTDGPCQVLGHEH
jgi:hypothetical protein